MNYQADIQFIPEESNLSKFDVLKHYAELLSDSLLIGLGVEHESAHYIEYTYYKWKCESIDIKLYWGDEDDNENQLILNVVSYDIDIAPLNRQLIELIQNYSEVSVNTILFS